MTNMTERLARASEEESMSEAEGRAKAEAILERVFYDAWEDAKLFYENRPTRAAFEAIIASLKYDGPDTDSLTVGEIRRALGEEKQSP